jgi:hypothetical protein
MMRAQTPTNSNIQGGSAMFKRTYATLFALVFSCCLAVTAQAAGDYSQSFASTPAGWNIVLGAWNTTFGDYRNEANTASPATASYYNSNSWTTNYTYKVQAYSEWPASGNQVGLVFGLTDDTHYYAVLVNMFGEVTINQISGTSNSTLATGNVVPADVGLAEDAWFNLDIFVNRTKDPTTGVNDGSDVTVRVNSKVAIAKFHLASVAGKIGVLARADKGHFRNVNVVDNLATRIFRGTFSGPADDPPHVEFYQDRCSQTPATTQPPEEANRWNCWGAIKGLDNSGDRWPFHLWGDDSELQYNSKSLDPAVRDFVDATLVSVPGHVNMNPDGSGGDPTTALYFQLKKMESLHHAPQILYNVQPKAGVTQHDLYMRFWAKVPTNSDLNYWHSLWQTKTANDRIIFNIETGTNGCTAQGTPRWVLASDNAASAAATVTHWKHCNASAVPIGKWFKVEMFMQRRPAGQESRFWVAIDNNQIFNASSTDGSATVGLFAPGSTQAINRIMLPQLYGGDDYPKYELADDMEVWDGFPSDASPH